MRVVVFSQNINMFFVSLGKFFYKYLFQKAYNVTLY